VEEMMRGAADGVAEGAVVAAAVVGISPPSRYRPEISRLVRPELPDRTLH
jgi:hypothetical protein